MILTIAIPTVNQRVKQFSSLYLYLNKQVIDNNLTEKVEVIYEQDNKEISIGAKREKLHQRAKGNFTVTIDDDDSVVDNFINTLVDLIDVFPDCDCIGYIEEVTGNEVTQYSHISNIHKGWGDHVTVEDERYRYVRTPYFKNPILTKYLLEIGVQDMRYAEDKDFSDRLKASGLIKNEVFLPRVMYHYRYKPEPHDSKYGIR